MIILVIILSFLAVSPLFHPGFFSMHDFQQVARLFEMDNALKAGQFPVRWVADLGFGYGYALFNFYPPLVYYLGEIFHLIGFSFINSIKLVWFVALLGSAVAMYFFAKRFFGKIGGLVSAVFYLYVPYHAIDAYVRGSLAELFSFVWLPLILLYSSKPVISGIFLALLMITHNLIFLPFVGIYVLWSRNIKNIFISLLIAFGLTAFFWLPSLAEKQYTLVDQFLTTGLASYKIHFVCPEQLWNSPWGYGGSIAGCFDGMSFMLGKIYFAAVILGLIISIWKKFKIGIVSFGLFIFSIFMTVPLSKFIWDNISLLWYLQFPWRFLEFTALFSSFLAGAFALVIKKSLVKIAIAAVLIFGVVYFNAKYFVPSAFIPNATDLSLLSDKEIKWTVSQTSFEYMPKGMALKATPQGSYILDIKNFPVEKYLVTNGDFLESESNFAPGKFLLSGESSSGASLQFQITNFPGWKIWIDKKEVVINDTNRLKLISVYITQGSHKIEGRFTNTFARTLGNFISLSAIIALVIGYFYARRRNQT